MPGDEPGRDLNLKPGLGFDLVAAGFARGATWGSNNGLLTGIGFASTCTDGSGVCNAPGSGIGTRSLVYVGSCSVVTSRFVCVFVFGFVLVRGPLPVAGALPVNV